MEHEREPGITAEEIVQLADEYEAGEERSHMNSTKLTEEEFYQLIQPGKVARFSRGKKGVNLQKEVRHIRAIVDEEAVVYRVWLKHKQYWCYCVKSLYEFWLDYDYGWLTIEEGKGA
jgi:hypothetical protein